MIMVERQIIATLVQYVALAVVLTIGVILVYVIFELRETYADHQVKFLRAVSAIEAFQKIQPELISSVNCAASDGRALQEIAIQIQSAVVDLNTGVSGALVSAAERHASALSELREHLDQRETKLEGLLSPPPRSSRSPGDETGYIRIAREALDRDGGLRLVLLRNWVASNQLTILRRAASSWTNPMELIAGVPGHLQAEAELQVDGVLLVGTRGEGERITVSLKPVNTASQVTLAGA